MQIKLIEGVHLTATNKRHIAEMLTRGMMQGGTKRIGYKFSSAEGNVAKFTLIQNERDDWGRPVTRRGNYVVEFTA